MATANKILGQVKPALATSTDLYTVPVATQTNLNVFIANQGAADKIRISLAPLGAALDINQYIAYDMTVDEYATINLTGICLSATDKIRIYSTNGTCSFVATGIEFV